MPTRTPCWDRAGVVSRAENTKGRTSVISVTGGDEGGSDRLSTVRIPTRGHAGQAGGVMGVIPKGVAGGVQTVSAQM